MLSLSTLLALEKNGTLADDELADIVEQSGHLKLSMRRRACGAGLHGDARPSALSVSPAIGAADSRTLFAVYVAIARCRCAVQRST